MNILTYSAVVGTAKCNVRCPFCVAVMTPHYEKLPEINLTNLRKGAKLSVRGGATTLLLTGKGEPTLYPDQITEILSEIGEDFPIVELQTNGLQIARKEISTELLLQWKRQGLTTIAVSCVHWDPSVNVMMNPREGDMPSLEDTVRIIKSAGFAVRLSVVMVKGGIDSLDALKTFIQWGKDHKVDQMTFRPVTRPEEADGKVAAWVKGNCVSEAFAYECQDYLDIKGTRLLDLAHGAAVYDVEGQNVCLTNCLTLDRTGEQIRQLIYCSDGHIRYDWRYEGAILF